MTKDVADDPFQVGGTPDVILRCADCGSVEQIGGTRWVHLDLPHEPLCPDCYGVAVRVWGEREGHLHPIGPPVVRNYEKHADGDPGYRRLCPRCNGTGSAPDGYRGSCFRCIGFRWVYVHQRDVRRSARWSQTFQQNRTP